MVKPVAHLKPKQIVRPSTTELAADALRAAIIAGELRMGAPLVEQALSEWLSISRTPLRHAFSELQNEGLIEIAPYRGARVFSPKADELLELGVFRSTLEVAAMRLAIDRDADALAGRLDRVIDAMRESLKRDGGSDYGRYDTEFHDTLIHECANRYVAASYCVVRARLAVLRNNLFRLYRSIISDPVELSGKIGGSLDDHVRLVALIREKRADEAVSILKTHIELGTRFYADNLECMVKI